MRRPIKYKLKSHFLKKKKKKSNPKSKPKIIENEPQSPKSSIPKSPKELNNKPLLLYKHSISVCNSNYPRFEELLNNHNIHFTDDIKKANAIYSSSLKKIMPIAGKYPKKRLIVFTHEPYWDLNRKKVMNYLGKKIRIINCYTGYYTNPYYYFPKKGETVSLIDLEDKILENRFREKKIKTCILASYHSDLIGKTKEGLCETRNKLGKKGKDMGLVDVYGKGWPRGYSQENSRDGKWKKRKSDILDKYFFNICFENSQIKNYVSEKLWDAIKNKNLPIYHGSKWLYEIFPKNSFIDYNQFKNPKELFKFIKKMTFQEWAQRLNLCISVFNNLLNTVDKNTTKDGAYLKLINAIQS